MTKKKNRNKDKAVKAQAGKKVNIPIKDEAEDKEQAECRCSQGAPEVVEPAVEPDAAELLDKLQRLAADYQNYQKRATRQIEQSGQYARENIARSLLPVLDNFDHTMEKGSQTQDVAAVMQGVQIVHDHLLNVLESAGMKKITVAPGSVFDPANHEAMMHEDTKEYEPNSVVRELAPGYVMNDRTLRPAKVSVARAPEVVVEGEDNEEGENEA